MSETVYLLRFHDFITIDDILTYNSLQIFPQGKMNQYQNMCGLYLTYSVHSCLSEIGPM